MMLTGNTEAYLHLDRLDEALAASKESQSLFSKHGDIPRAVKTYAQLGKKED